MGSKARPWKVGQFKMNIVCFSKTAVWLENIAWARLLSVSRCTVDVAVCVHFSIKETFYGRFMFGCKSNVPSLPNKGCVNSSWLLWKYINTNCLRLHFQEKHAKTYINLFKCVKAAAGGVFRTQRTASQENTCKQTKHKQIQWDLTYVAPSHSRIDLAHNQKSISHHFDNTCAANAHKGTK